jgi:hypothetical protein
MSKLKQVTSLIMCLIPFQFLPRKEPFSFLIPNRFVNSFFKLTEKDQKSESGGTIFAESISPSRPDNKSVNRIKSQRLVVVEPVEREIFSSEEDLIFVVI